jgi:hypothetical protein
MSKDSFILFDGLRGIRFKFVMFGKVLKLHYNKAITSKNDTQSTRHPAVGGGVAPG